MHSSRARRRVVIVAYHYPPIQGSTGVTRTLAFSRMLPALGWDVAVLTVHTRAYPEMRAENLKLIPDDVRVVRAFALDTQRHLSIRGRYLDQLALPDRWQSWIAGGTLAGLRLARSWKPDVIMSTYPIASAHAIGANLARATGIPWVADFRDPMVQENYPTNARMYRAFEKVEGRTFEYAARIVVTTPGTADLYRERFPSRADRIRVIQNGFDEDMFAACRDPRVAGNGGPPQDSRRITLLHSGLLYPHERNPEHFFRAVAQLVKAGRIDGTKVRFVLRASGEEARYAARIAELDIGAVVKLEPSVPYREALEEMLQVDGLLLFQAASCNQQIPAKIYEYLYAGRPIMAFTDPQGDTGRLLAATGTTHVAPLDRADLIADTIMDFISRLREGSAPVAPREVALRYSRRAAAEQLAALLAETAR